MRRASATGKVSPRRWSESVSSRSVQPSTNSITRYGVSSSSRPKSQHRHDVSVAEASRDLGFGSQALHNFGGACDFSLEQLDDDLLRETVGALNGRRVDLRHTPAPIRSPNAYRPSRLAAFMGP